MRLLAALAILAALVAGFGIGRASAGAASSARVIPSSAFVPVLGPVDGRESVPGPSGRPVPVAVPSASPNLSEAKRWARARLSAAEWSCLDAIVRHESGWRLHAVNPVSGAYGFFQAYPASKLRWGRDAMGQMRFGFAYARARYGSFCGGWAHIERVGWW